MSVITVSRLATPDEISAEMDRRGEVIARLETDLRHWREECGKLHATKRALLDSNKRMREALEAVECDGDGKCGDCEGTGVDPYAPEEQP